MTESAAYPEAEGALSRCCCLITKSSPLQLQLQPGLSTGARAQMDGRDGAPRQYRGMIDCFRQVACKEGLAGLYKARARAATLACSALGAVGIIYAWVCCRMHCCLSL